MADLKSHTLIVFERSGMVIFLVVSAVVFVLFCLEKDYRTSKYKIDPPNLWGLYLTMALILGLCVSLLSGLILLPRDEVSVLRVTQIQDLRYENAQTVNTFPAPPDSTVGYFVYTIDKGNGGMPDRVKYDGENVQVLRDGNNGNWYEEFCQLPRYKQWIGLNFGTMHCRYVFHVNSDWSFVSK